ncbi:hypothetical protein SBV1_160015 [Verrucomicrobia bacterium]|nr:hypothetical protein SBV1_160015 [Verrucomicrobiota bacterium]
MPGPSSWWPAQTVLLQTPKRPTRNPRTPSRQRKRRRSSDSKPAKKKAKKLGGQELYAIHCNRCHAERYPTEFTPSHWKTVLMHMRVRANLPAAQAKEVLKYLQEESGS